jgi:predicted AlkP superfamily phosphohydrolase/phosphomutase
MDVFNHSEDGVFAEPEPARRGDHTRYGIFGLYSNSAKADSKNISVLDIAPTILDYYKVDMRELTKGSRLMR